MSDADVDKSTLGLAEAAGIVPEGTPAQRKIIHIDMGAFYASVEQRDNPDLRGMPRNRLPTPDIRNPRIVVGKFLRNDDTLLGAVALVLHQHGRVTASHRKAG